MSKYAVELEKLLKKPFFNSHQARDMGVPIRMLSHYCNQGIIERISRGMYRAPEQDLGIDMAFEELVLTAASIPQGVVCLVSALVYYNLTDQIMREFWIAVPNACRYPVRPHLRPVRMRNIDLGLTEVRVGKLKMRIFDKERTVVDAFRFLSHEIALKALQTYLKKPDLQKLSAYAKILKVNLTPYLLALTT
jgi:predicted transcriptional regulator of viral defense system